MARSETIIIPVLVLYSVRQMRMRSVKYRDELSKQTGYPVRGWYITEAESARLTKLFGREFKDLKMVGTNVNGAPRRCKVCSKWFEYYDWYIRLAFLYPRWQSSHKND